MTESAQELATRWKRLGGALIDSLIAIAVTLPVMLATGVFKETMQGQQMTIGQQIFFFFFGLAVFLLINGYLLAKSGQTVGKRIVGTRIVSIDRGQLLPFREVFGLRYVPLYVIGQIPMVGFLFFLADALFIFREDKRCIHDLIAGSIVVDA
ncbi:MAG: RDD family protein [Desulfosalsimonas sp.]